VAKASGNSAAAASANRTRTRVTGAPRRTTSATIAQSLVKCLGLGRGGRGPGGRPPTARFVEIPRPVRRVLRRVPDRARRRRLPVAGDPCILHPGPMPVAGDPCCGRAAAAAVTDRGAIFGERRRGRAAHDDAARWGRRFGGDASRCEGAEGEGDRGAGAGESAPPCRARRTFARARGTGGGRMLSWPAGSPPETIHREKAYHRKCPRAGSTVGVFPMPHAPRAAMR
jgi:hypothetical protein